MSNTCENISRMFSNVYICSNMRKYMFKFLNKFKGSGIKIARVNSIRIAKPMIFLNILHAVAR